MRAISRAAETAWRRFGEEPFSRETATIVFSALVESPPPIFLQFVLAKADGSIILLGIPSGVVTCIAAAGDGRIYFFAPGPQPILRYIDAGNSVHDVLDATGTVPFVPTTSFTVRAMFFDAGTSSLFMGISATGFCGIAPASATILKIPLSADGTKVGGAVQSAPICALFATTTNEIVNLSEGPGGSLFAVIDDNSADAVGRMVLIDKQTLAATTYAVNSGYAGVPATVAGVYSHALNCAVIDDGESAKTRLYGFGGTGAGTTWASGEGVAANALTTMIEIPTTHANGLEAYGTGTPGCNGAHGLYTNGPPTVGAADFRFTCTNAPANALGLLIVGDVPDFGGTDPFGFGAKMHVNLFASSFLTGLNINANASGFAASPAPIPILPTFVGATVDAQALWVWGAACTATLPLGIASSTGLAVTFNL